MTVPDPKRAKLLRLLRYVKKTLGSLLGAATGAGVLAVLHAVGIDVSVEAATAIAGVCAAIGTYLAPVNTLTVKQISKLVRRL